MFVPRADQSRQEGKSASDITHRLVLGEVELHSQLVKVLRLKSRHRLEELAELGLVGVEFLEY